MSNCIPLNYKCPAELAADRRNPRSPRGGGHHQKPPDVRLRRGSASSGGSGRRHGHRPVGGSGAFGPVSPHALQEALVVWGVHLACGRLVGAHAARLPRHPRARLADEPRGEEVPQHRGGGEAAKEGSGRTMWNTPHNDPEMVGMVKGG
eukprot:EG_transcript_20404